MKSSAERLLLSGFNNNNVLPVTQGLGQSQRQTTSCPAVSNVSPVSQGGPVNSPTSLYGLVQQFGPHPPTQPLVAFLSLRVPLKPAL